MAIFGNNSNIFSIMSSATTQTFPAFQLVFTTHYDLYSANKSTTRHLFPFIALRVKTR